MLFEFLTNSVLSIGAKKLTERLIDRVPLPTKQKQLDSDQVFKALSAHMESNYERCYYIKTILRDKKELFSDIYSDQGFILPNGERINQNQLADFIKNGEPVILQGTGGGGKSMFTRYMWLYLLAESDSVYPIFLELRNLNGLSNSNVDRKDLETYLYHSIINNSAHLSQNQFIDLLRDGKFTFLLDGFDELNHQIRDSVQRSVVEFKSLYKRCNVVVTSREDERFVGWHLFSTVKMAPLTKDECIKLLRKAPFDPDQRRKMIEKVDAELFETHSTFLSNPLLAYMTLVTYSYNPNFTDNMFQFYELAFDALYYRHDLTKGGGFSREFYTTKDKAKFQKFLSYFCLRTYFDEKIEFSPMTLRDYLQEVKKIENDDFSIFNIDDFIKDIMENVCLLKKDGIDFTFVHRKFQEYFAAYCIARVASRNVERLFEKFSYRYTDDVLPMVYDLKPDLFREKYICEIRKKNIKFFSLKTPKNIVQKFADITEFAFVIEFTDLPQERSRKKTGAKFELRSFFPEFIAVRTSGDLNEAERVLSRVYNRPEASSTQIVDNDEGMEYPSAREDQVLLHKVCHPYLRESRKYIIRYQNNKLRLYIVVNNEEREIVDSIFETESEKMFLHRYIRRKAKRFHNFVNREAAKYESVSESFDDFFG
ncbi:NACHT domain-containing protein [Fulvimarina sp. MAC3]|uniref:NACHT domain-containing protein n=1 Tax=Fulvimarina sp. MAC3 TaxID=3148887 RepID=UPI0031FDEA5D